MVGGVSVVICEVMVPRVSRAYRWKNNTIFKRIVGRR